jgi:hypothetical protein
LAALSVPFALPPSTLPLSRGVSERQRRIESGVFAAAAEALPSGVRVWIESCGRFAGDRKSVV